MHAGGESKCNVLTRFDAFVLIVADTGRPTHGHTDGYDGLGLGLNRDVKIMYVLSIEFGLHTPRKCLHLCIHLQGAGMKMSTSRGSVSLIACSATCCCSASSMCVDSGDLQANQAKFDTAGDK